MIHIMYNIKTLLTGLMFHRCNCNWLALCRCFKYTCNKHTRWCNLFIRRTRVARLQPSVLSRLRSSLHRSLSFSSPSRFRCVSLCTVCTSCYLHIISWFSLIPSVRFEAKSIRIVHIKIHIIRYFFFIIKEEDAHMQTRASHTYILFHVAYPIDHYNYCIYLAFDEVH